MAIKNFPLLSIDTFPRAILHIDGDAFFASCEQSRNPALKGRPVVTGKERGIAASMSYEAKASGAERGMRIFEIKRVCPEAVILPSDYETYSLLSKRFYSIVRRFTPEVEEYGIDECFADITGLQRPLKMNYQRIAQKIKEELDRELGFTFSVGLGPNKTIAKIASKWKKPSGLTVISARQIHLFIADLPVGKVWGIGKQSEAYLNKLGIHTAIELARKSEWWVKKNFTKPTVEIWSELNGKFEKPLNIEEGPNKTSVQKFRTFTPPSRNREFIFSQLSKNIENACIKLRRHKLAAKKVIFFLKTQDFYYYGTKFELSRATNIPSDLICLAEKSFNEFFNPKFLYRAAGTSLFDIEIENSRQLDIFGKVLRAEKLTSFFKAVDVAQKKHGKHTLYLATSFWANKFAQHLGKRGDIPKRKGFLVKGETARRRIGIPMLIGEEI